MKFLPAILKLIRKTPIKGEKSNLCYNTSRVKHIVDLPYEKDFREKQIPTKARPIQMNEELLQYGQKEIKDLLSQTKRIYLIV